MSIFDKLFRRNRNNVKLSPEEAFAPETREEAVKPAEPEVKPEPETKPEVKPEPEKPPVAAEPEKARVVFTKNIHIYAAAANPDEINSILRPLFVEKGVSVSEDTESMNVQLDNQVNASFRRAEDGFDARLIRRYSVLSNPNVPALLEQIRLFNVALNVRVSAGSRDSLSDAKPLVEGAAQLLNGFIEWDESALHTADGRLLMDISGNTDFETYVAEAAAPEPVDPDLARMEKSFETMKEHGITYDSGKPVQIPSETAALRPLREIAERAACLFGCVLTASAYSSPKEIAAPAAFSEKALTRLQEQYNVINNFTAKEKQYIKKPQYHSAYMMRSEACAVLLWAMGYIDLPWPDTITAADKLGAVLKGSDLNRLISCAHMRTLEEVLDLQDLTYRLHSYCVLRENTAGINEDAVYERHYALNWLLSVNGISAWDDIIPKT